MAGGERGRAHGRALPVSAGLPRAGGGGERERKVQRERHQDWHQSPWLPGAWPCLPWRSLVSSDPVELPSAPCVMLDFAHVMRALPGPCDPVAHVLSQWISGLCS